jgi:D-aminopeptidase
MSCGPLPRARDLGVKFDGEPAPQNAITDVGGVQVGYTRLSTAAARCGPAWPAANRGDGTAAARPGRHRSGVRRGLVGINGNGEMTGTTWIEERTAT